jgi:hypothetical protein
VQLLLLLACLLAGKQCGQQQMQTGGRDLAVQAGLKLLRMIGKGCHV